VGYRVIIEAKKIRTSLVKGDVRTEY
jgi:hypothetical protein